MKLYIVFGVILTAIVDHIFANPGILQEKILEHFVHRLVSPVSILEFLDRLVKSKIIKIETVKVRVQNFDFSYLEVIFLIEILKFVDLNFHPK